MLLFFIMFMHSEKIHVLLYLYCTTYNLDTVEIVFFHVEVVLQVIQPSAYPGNASARMCMLDSSLAK